jgi:beta-galactosidase
MQKMNLFLKYCCLSAIVSMILTPCFSQDVPKRFEIQNGKFIADGEELIIRSGEIHYSRIPKEYWHHRLRMIRAMGLNTIATCVFWNYHNTAPGNWDFESGNKNLPEFIRTAQEEGLYVILRPGPYVCAEWEYGGYPWWLTLNDSLVVRTNNQAFLDSCQVYFTKLAEQVKDLQVTRGGPIIMVQVENEFGSYMHQRTDIPLPEHTAYYHTIYQMLQEAGFEVPFFTSDGTWMFNGGAIPGVLPTANGEGNIENLKKAVDQYFPGGPYMVAEFYPGWLDHWGEEFTRISAEDNLVQLRNYLENDINFNFYMVHGGTNFGFTSGANFNEEFAIQPDLTSYDYDAPISEAGWPTEKYKLLREEIIKYTPHPIPDVPPPIPVIEIPDIPINTSVDFFSWITKTKPVKSATPLSFEDLKQGSGYVLYKRHFKQPISGTLKIEGLRDYAIVYVNGRKVGELNRMQNKYTIAINIPFNGTLSILAENLGRINYGSEIVNNTKGIIAPIYINEYEITGDWLHYRIPLNAVPDLQQSAQKSAEGNPAFYVAKFNLEKTGDTYLTMRDWGKGIIFVNGINIGRYWSIGPQQTLFVPGCWLKKGENEIILFEQQNDSPPDELKFLTQPNLYELNLHK